MNLFGRINLYLIHGLEKEKRINYDHRKTSILEQSGLIGNHTRKGTLLYNSRIVVTKDFFNVFHD